jgi:ABC-type Zn uptake system ZnuABC Zn-binding protein ZnuA
MRVFGLLPVLLLCAARATAEPPPSPSLAFGSLRGSDAEAPRASAPLAVVATIVPLAWLVEELGGERVSVHALVPPGASPHAFEPRPSDLARVAEARLFVSAGRGVDDWVASIAVAEGPAPLVLLDALGPGQDPHFWLDPIAVRDGVLPVLEAAFATADPDGREHYAGRRRAFAHALSALDHEIRSALAGVVRRPVVPLHDAWGAFAARYGIPLLAPVEQRAAEEPTPRTLARLADAARAGGAVAVLVEPQLPPAAAAALAESLGVPSVVADPYGDPRVPERASYEALLAFDTEAFRRAMLSRPASDARSEPQASEAE